VFRHILLSAIVAGIVTGLALTGVQRVEVVPIILEAERYEAAGGAADQGRDHGHDPGAAAAHDHEDAAGGTWAPEEGAERTVWTAIANVSIGIGYALLLCAAYAWRGRVDLREGVLWGIGGFAVFFVNPAFGLPPEIPGSLAADLDARQLWWFATVICTAAGLGLIAFRREWQAALGGAALCLAPHLLGAPQPDQAGGGAPLALAHEFVHATYLANAIFWVLLGVATAWCFARFAPRTR